ncbi:YvrJ protein family [Mycobacteroides abscessus subsp. abscessus]|nr:YvrJ protein family [Mycobacteroides abscessus subsp. abscessus]
MFEQLNLLQIIGNFGFPIAITMYLLHRYENRFEQLKMKMEDISRRFVTAGNRGNHEGHRA